MGGKAKGGGQQAIEPVKSVEDAMRSAGDASARMQQLRSGIASTFNRRTAFAMTPQAAGTLTGATSGASSKLGG